ncbi:MAG: hypothetical protein QG635_1691 [Bacteroidota bacterium]|nr:hypothetical protein [Bacteroidota bacterium]
MDYKVVKTKKVEGCLEGSNAYDIMLDNPVEKKLIDKLGELGKLIYISSFDKPFYRVIARGKYTLKGVETNKTFRVLLPDSSGQETLNEIIRYIELMN